MSLCTKTHLVSDAGGESPTPTHSSAAFRSCRDPVVRKAPAPGAAASQAVIRLSAPETAVTQHICCCGCAVVLKGGTTRLPVPGEWS